MDYGVEESTSLLRRTHEPGQRALQAEGFKGVLVALPLYAQRGLRGCSSPLPLYAQRGLRGCSSPLPLYAQRGLRGCSSPPPSWLVCKLFFYVFEYRNNILGCSDCNCRDLRCVIFGIILKRNLDKTVDIMRMYFFERAKREGPVS